MTPGKIFEGGHPERSEGSLKDSSSAYGGLRMTTLGLNLSIITPIGKAYENTVRAVVAPGQCGYFGILKDHAPLMTILSPGTLKVTEDQDKEIFFAVDSGVLEVSTGDNVVVLADHAAAAGNEKEAKAKAEGFGR